MYRMMWACGVDCWKVGGDSCRPSHWKHGYLTAATVGSIVLPDACAPWLS